MSKIIEELESKLAKKGKGKKEECLELLRGGCDSIANISEQMGIKNTNVSSLFSYLRKDGFVIESVRVRGEKILIFCEPGESLGKINA